MALKSLGVPMDPLEWVGQGDLALLNEHKTELFHGPQETLEKEVRCKFYRGSTGKSPFFGGRGLLGDQMLVAFPGS